MPPRVAGAKIITKPAHCFGSVPAGLWVVSKYHSLGCVGAGQENRHGSPSAKTEPFQMCALKKAKR